MNKSVQLFGFPSNEATKFGIDIIDIFNFDKPILKIMPNIGYILMI